MGTFEEIDIRNGEMQYTLTNQDVMPLRIMDLFRLLHFADGGEDLSAKRLKKTVENKMELSCIETNSTNSAQEQQKVCVAPESGEISSINWREFPDEVFREQLSDYTDFGGHRYPRDLRFYENGSKVVSAQVRNLSTIAFEETLLNPPRGAIERRKCPDMRVPQAIKLPMPIYPKSAHQNRIAGDVIVSAVVLTDGTVSDARIIGGATHDMDAAVQAATKHWRFRPAMCGLDPVVTDIQVTVTFRMD
jgi:TonB family protein